MNTSRSRSFFCFLVIISTLACSGGESEPPENDGQSEPPENGLEASLMWILVHPNQPASRGPGIYLYDKAQNVVLDILPLPPGATSPHALEWDGEVLWVASFVHDDPNQRAIFAMHPETGAIERQINNVTTEGLTKQGESFWLGSVRGIDPNGDELIQYDGDWNRIGTLSIGANVQALTSDSKNLYYVSNSEHDEVFKIDPAGNQYEISVGAFEGQAPYSLDFDGSHLLAVDGDRFGNDLIRIDINTGETLARTKLPIDGWITDIAVIESKLVE